MNKEETNALQLLTGKTHLDEVSVDELKQLATDYPYFSIAQLLFSKKLQHEHYPETQQQLYKTSLYFPNEPWLHYLLLSTDQRIDDEIFESHPVVENKIENIEPLHAEVEDEEVETSTIIEQQQPTLEKVPDDKEDNIISLDNEQQLSNESNDNISLPEEKSEEEITAANLLSEPEELPLDEDELAQQTEPLPIEESNQKIANLLSEQAEEFHKPVAPEQAVVIETEPYHTVDYFASQGIKLDVKKEDTGFDKKVHKFTDWLRQMKRINPLPADLGTDTEEETHIVNIAASSNQTKEIVTESMAEVLLKQNKRDKAVEIYEKLSLLYPSKNAYFAAKIQQLKQ